MKQDRFYWNGKQHVPSGTTVIGLVDKPALRTWAAGCAVDYILDNGVWQKNYILAGNPAVELTIDTEMTDKARTAFERESMQAADYGTYMHTVCRYSLENNTKLESPHEMTQKFMDGLWAWKEKHNVKVIAMEHEVVTDTYGGRLDLVCEMDGIITLIDFKTGKASYYDTWKYQLAGYRNGWNGSAVTVIPKDGAYLYPKIKHHGILKFNKKTIKVNYKDFTEYQATRTNPETLEKEKYKRTYKEDLATFMACVRLWWGINRGIEV